MRDFRLFMTTARILRLFPERAYKAGSGYDATRSAFGIRQNLTSDFTACSGVYGVTQMIFRLSFMIFTLLLANACATVAPQTAEAEEDGAQDVASAPAPSFVRADFMGKETPALDAALGEPGLIRVEGDGEFRRYGLAGCALIIILYPDDDGVRRAAHLDAAALTSSEEKPDLDQCLAGKLGASAA